MPDSKTIETIQLDALASVSAGVSTSNDQLTTMLTQITSSIKDLANNKNQSDPTQLLLIMMMMGGFGGGGGVIGGFGPPIINVDTSLRGRWRGSKKGW